MIVGSIFSVIGIESKESAALAAVVFIGTIFLSVTMLMCRSEDEWYRARAIAESVKTSTWRFMMKGAPYLDSTSIEQVKKEFRNLLRSILAKHNDLAHEFGGAISESEQITEKMCDIRRSVLARRIEFYREFRIDEQRCWYARKSAESRKKGKFWFGFLIALQAMAVVLVIFRVAYPQFGMWPTEVFVVAAGSALTWIQIKRFRELASSYGFTSQEIGIIRGELEEVKSDEDFVEFVRDSENAFSREHTQWIARKTNPAG
ncbi:MAG: DUF4231 domain-containing protein [Verrucomicrobiales bacterium]